MRVENYVFRAGLDKGDIAAKKRLDAKSFEISLGAESRDEIIQKLGDIDLNGIDIVSVVPAIKPGLDKNYVTFSNLDEFDESEAFEDAIVVADYFASELNHRVRVILYNDYFIEKSGFTLMTKYSSIIVKLADLLERFPSIDIVIVNAAPFFVKNGNLSFTGYSVDSCQRLVKGLNQYIPGNRIKLGFSVCNALIAAKLEAIVSGQENSAITFVDSFDRFASSLNYVQIANVRNYGYRTDERNTEFHEDDKEFLIGILGTIESMVPYCMRSLSIDTVNPKVDLATTISTIKEMA